MIKMFFGKLLFFFFLSNTCLFSQELSDNLKPYYLTIDKNVTGSESFYKISKSEHSDAQVLMNIHSKGDGVEKDVLIIAPEGPGGMVPASVEKKVRELKNEAKKQGIKINPKVLLFSNDYVQEANAITKKYKDALNASMDMSGFNSSFFADDPKAQELLETGDRGALIDYLMDKAEEKPELLPEAEKKSVGVLQTLRDRFKNMSPEVRSATFATLGLKVLIQGFSCYFAVYLADNKLSPEIVVPFVAFNITMTVLINSFIDWFIKIRSVCESGMSNLHDRKYENFKKTINSWQATIKERKASGEPWVLDAMLYRIIDGGLSNLGKGFHKFNKAVIRGDMAFQYGVSLFFLGANWAIVGLGGDYLQVVEGMKAFFGSSHGSITALSVGLLAMYVTLKNVISGIPIDVVNSYFNRVGLFKDKTSIWYSLFPEMLWQKDKLASVGLGVLNDALNIMITIVGLPAYILAHLIYPPVKDKEKIDEQKAEDLKVKQYVKELKLYPDERAMYEFLGKKYPDGAEELSPKDKINKMVEASMEKLLYELYNSKNPKKYVGSNSEFLLGNAEYPGFLRILISKAYSMSGYEDRKSFLNSISDIMNYLPVDKVVLQRDELELVKEWNDGVKSNLLMNNLNTALNKVYGVDTKNLDLNKLIDLFIEKENEKRSKDLDPLCEKALFGSHLELYKDSLLYYLLVKFDYTLGEYRENLPWKLRLLEATYLSVEKYDIRKSSPQLMTSIYESAEYFCVDYMTRLEESKERFERDKLTEKEIELEKEKILKESLDKEIREIRSRYDYRRGIR